MFTDKLKKMVRRQSALVAKGAEVTAEEKAELDKLNAAIIVATEEPKVEKSTRLTTMNKEQFAAYVTTEKERLEAAPTAEGIAIYKRNVEQVKEQLQNGAEIFAVELPVEKTEKEESAEHLKRIAALEEKVENLVAKLEAATSKEEEKTEETEPEAAAKEEEEPAEEAAATEEEKPAEEEAATEEEKPAEEEAAADEPVVEKGAEEVSWDGDLAKSGAKDADEEYRMLKNAGNRG